MEIKFKESESWVLTMMFLRRFSYNRALRNHMGLPVDASSSQRVETLLGFGLEDTNYQYSKLFLMIQTVYMWLPL